MRNAHVPKHFFRSFANYMLARATSSRTAREYGLFAVLSYGLTARWTIPELRTVYEPAQRQPVAGW